MNEIKTYMVVLTSEELNQIDLALSTEQTCFENREELQKYGDRIIAIRSKLVAERREVKSV